MAPQMRGPFNADDAETMVYTVDLGNGHIADVEGPKGATPEQLQQFVQQAQGGSPANNVGQDNVQGGFADEQPPQPASHLSPEDEAKYMQLVSGQGSADEIRAFMSHRGFTMGDDHRLEDYVANRDAGKPVHPQLSYELSKMPDDGRLAATARGVADSVLFGTLPKAGAAIGALEQSLSGKSSFGDAYDRILDANNATIANDEQDHPWERVGGQLLGGLVLPAGMEGVGLKAGTDVLRAGGTMSEARVAAKFAVRNSMAAVGGAYGAAHGAGSADTLSDAVSGAAAEGALGAATGGLLGQGGRSAKVDERVSTATSDAKNVFDAAQRQGITPLPADVGGATTRRATAAAAQMPFAAGRIAEAGQRVTEQGQAARDRVAASVGQALNPEAAGQQALSGAQKYIASSKAQVSGAYRAAETAAGDTHVPPTAALAELDRHIAELSQTPGGAPALSQLQGLRDALSKGDVSIAGLRNMRTVLRDQFMKDGLRGSDTERRVGLVMDAARQDITDGLNAAGKGNAARLFTAADAQHAERARTIDSVLKPLIGTRDAPKSAEQITKALTADLQGNNARAVKFLRALPEEDQANTRASIIGQMGRVSAGAQNPEGDAFSLPAFLTSWSKIGETAKRAYFGDEARAALNDLAIVANGTKLAQKYANHSNTAGGLEWGRLLTTVTALPTLGGSVGGQFALGHLLASPRFARWLARAPKSSLSQAAYADRLTRIARAEPSIANEVLQLQQRLADTFTSVPARMAAQEPINGVPQRQRNEAEQQGQQEGAQP